MEIPSDQWPGFCREFTRQHRGWLVTVALAARGSAERETLVHDAVLQGLSRERRGPHTALVVSVGTAENHMSHRIPAPAHLTLEEAPDGAHKGLRIVSNNGDESMIEFRAPTRPGSLDGIVEVD